MTHPIKRALALILALLLAIPAFAFAEPLDDDFEIMAFEEVADADEGAEEAAAEVELDLSELEAPAEEEGDVEIEEVADEEEASEEAALVVENPAFVQSVTMEDGVTITVKAAEGVFPDGATLSVEPKADMGLVGKVDGEVAAMYTYDIKVLDANGVEQIQPDDDTLVEIIFNAPEVANSDYQTVVFHVVDEEEEIVDELIVSEDGANASVFSDHFSYYQVVFVYKPDETTQTPTDTLETAVWKVNQSEFEGIRLSALADKVYVANGIKLNDAQAMGAIDDTVVVGVSPAAAAYLTAEKVTYHPNPNLPAEAYDWVITPTAAFAEATTLDENVYITVTKTINNSPFTWTIYLKSATKRMVKIGDTYYESLEKALAAVTTGQTIEVLNDLTETASTLQIYNKVVTLALGTRTVTLSCPLEVTENNGEAALTLTGSGTLAGSIVLDGGAALSVPAPNSGNGLTVTGDITTRTGTNPVVIGAGTFKGAVTATSITGGTFDAAVTVSDGAVSGGKFAEAYKLADAKLNSNYAQVLADGYWTVVTKASMLSIAYNVVKPTAVADTYTNYTNSAVTIPTTDKYSAVASANTVLWDAATAYADYGEVECWYAGTTYPTAAQIAAGTAVKVSEIPAKSAQTGPTLNFVGKIVPFVASFNGTNYKTWAEAAAAGVNGSVPVIIKSQPLTIEKYKLAAGSSIKVKFDAVYPAPAAANVKTEAAKYVDVEPGYELKVEPAGTPTDGIVTFTAVAHIASVKPSASAQPVKWYEEFYTKNATGTVDATKFALDVALADAGSVLSIPAANDKVMINDAVAVSKSFEIVGFDNIYFTTFGSMKVASGTTLTIDSANFDGKVVGTDAAAPATTTTCKLTVKTSSSSSVGYTWTKVGTTWMWKLDTPVATVTDSQKVFKGEYATLKEAIAAASAGDIVTLNQNVALAVKTVAPVEDGIVTVDKNITLNLAGKTLSSNGVNTIVVTGGATLKLTDSANGDGVTNTYSTTTAGRAILIDNGTLELVHVKVSKGGSSLYAISSTANGTLLVEGQGSEGTTTNTTHVNGNLENVANATITSGFFSDQNVKALLADGYYLGALSDGYYPVQSNGLAMIVETGVTYSTLADAITNATKGQTIKLLNNFTQSAQQNVDKDLTIDLNGKKITINNANGFFRVGFTTPCKLTLAGTGTIEATVATGDNGIFTVYGSSNSAATYIYGLDVPATVTIKAVNRAVRVRGNAAYGVQIDLAGEIETTAANGSAIAFEGGLENVTTGNVPVVNVGGKIKSQVNVYGYAKVNVNADINNEVVTEGTGAAIYAHGGEVTISGGTYVSTKGPAVYKNANIGKLVISGGSFTASNNVLNVTTAADVSVTGGTFKATTKDANAVNVAAALTGFISGGLFSSSIADDLCKAGYACTQEANADKLYEVKEAWTVTFRSQTYDSTTKTWTVATGDPHATRRIVKGEVIKKAKMPEYPQYLTYGADYWFDKDDASAAPFVVGETVLTKDTTLVAHFVAAEASITKGGITKRYATLEEAFDLWRGYTVNEETGVETFTAAPTDTLTYLVGATPTEYTIAAPFANIKAENIKAVVDGAIAGAGAGNGTVAIAYTTTSDPRVANTWLIQPVARATVGGTPTPGYPISNDMIEAKASLTVSGLTTTDLAGKVTVLIGEDQTCTNLLQTVTDQTVTSNVLTVNGVKKFGYFKAMTAKVSMTTAGGATSYYADLASAFAAAKEAPGATVTMLSDLPATSVVAGENVQYVSAVGDFTLDLNGKRITSGTTVKVNDGGTAAAPVASTLTVVDGSDVATAHASTATIEVNGKSNLVFESGEITGNPAIKQNSTGTVTVNGGLIKGGTNGAIQIAAAGPVAIAGGDIGGKHSVSDAGVVSWTPDASTAFGINGTAVNNQIVINGGYIYGATYAVNLAAGSNASITGGFFGATTDELYGDRLCVVTGGLFMHAVKVSNCGTDVNPTTNLDEKTAAWGYTVLTGAVAVYKDANLNDIYVTEITDAVLTKASGVDLKLLTDAEITAPLMAAANSIIDLAGHKLTVKKMTAEQFAALSAAEKTAKGLTSLEDAKYGFVVNASKQLTIKDSTDIYSTVGTGIIEDATDLEATISVAANGTLIVSTGSIDKQGAGAAILDKGTVSVAATSGNITAASGTAIDVLDGTLTVSGGKGVISGKNAVKFAASATDKAGKLTISGGKLTGTTGAALVVDNTGKTIVKTTPTTNFTNIVNVSNGIFTAPSGISPIQTLDENGAVAVKPAATATTKPAYVTSFVVGGNFSAILDNDTLVNGYTSGAAGGNICKTVANTTTGMYTIVDKRTVTLTAGDGATFKDKDGKDIATLTVYVPDGQLLTTAAEYQEPTKPSYDFNGWKNGSDPFAYKTTPIGATPDKLTADWTEALYTVVVNMNGGVFTEDKAYTNYLFTTSGNKTKRVYSSGVLTITGVKESTAMSDLVLLSAKSTYAAEFAGAASSMVFNNWQTADGTAVTTINKTVATDHVVTVSAHWNDVMLSLYDDTTFVGSKAITYGTAMTADQMKAALYEIAGVNPSDPDAGIAALVEKHGLVGVTLDVEDMFDPTPAAVTMTTPVSYRLKWIPLTAKHTLTFMVNGAEYDKQEIFDGKLPVVPESPTDPFQAFVQWETEDGKVFDATEPVTADATYIATWTFVCFLDTARASLAGKVKLNIYYYLPDSAIAAEGAAFEYFFKNDKTPESEIVKKTILLSEGEKAGDYYYRFSVEAKLPAFADVLTFKLVDMDGKAIPCQAKTSGKDVTDGMTYSLKQYAESQSKDPSTSMGKLALSILDYGTASQINFKYGAYEGLTVDKRVTDVTVEDMAEVPDRVITGKLPDGVTGQATATVEGDHMLNAYFVLPEGKTADDYDFTVAKPGAAAEAVTAVPSGRAGKGNEYKVTVSNIAANHLNDVYEIGMKDKNATSGWTVKMSLLTYFKRSMGSSTDMANMTKAIFLYYKAAKAYGDEHGWA